MSSSNAPALKKNSKKLKKKKLVKPPKNAYCLDGIVTAISPILLKNFNRTVLEDRKDSLFYYDNY